MIVGIEASNILAGGGLVHLKELLTHATPTKQGIERVVVWAPNATLNQLPNKEWLIKKTHPWLNSNIVLRALWLYFVFPKKLNTLIDVLFVPGANGVSFSPTVSMCQNLLPFDAKERRLYGLSWMRLRLKVLHYSQLNSFRKASRVFFLTPSSVNYVAKYSYEIANKAVVVPHGISSVFYNEPLDQLNQEQKTIKILYVSIVDVYKHQWNVTEAVFSLLEKGYDVELELVGSSYSPSYEKLQRVMIFKPQYKNKITYSPKVSYESLKSVYQNSDIFVFASSCETFSLILLEAMASGLPIACSDKDTLRDTLQEAGLYFDPYDSKDIERALLVLIENKILRQTMKRKAFDRAITYSWAKCADLTFNCLAEVGKETIKQ